VLDEGHTRTVLSQRLTAPNVELWMNWLFSCKEPRGFTTYCGLQQSYDKPWLTKHLPRAAEWPLHSGAIHPLLLGYSSATSLAHSMRNKEGGGRRAGHTSNQLGQTRLQRDHQPGSVGEDD
jgi:hypothetical protein